MENEIDLFKPDVENFILQKGLSPIRSRWIYHCEEQEVYLRIGPKIIENKKVECIQIANIHTQEKNQKKGIFTGFLKWLEKFDQAVYVENAHNPCLPPFLLKNGFKHNETPGYEYDYYKLKQ